MNGETDTFLAIHHQIALTIALLLLGINLVANLRMMDRAAPRGKGSQERQMVSVLVPARNEARNIRRCLQSLLAQDYTPFEILVLDDNSTDETPAIVAAMARKEPRLRLVRGTPLPQGWMGKNYACHQLARLARGDWLLFTDADTDHHPTTLRWAIQAAQQNKADLTSLIPHTVTHSLGEQLILPIIPFGLLSCFPMALGQRVRIPFLTMAVGPFMLFRRESYRRIGGHEEVRGEIAEDVILARQMRKADGRVSMLDGSEQLDVHFYHGFREAWHGLAKSVFAVFEYRPLPCALLIGLYTFLFLWPLVLLFVGIKHGHMDEATSRLALIQVLLNSGLWYTVAARFRLPRRTAVLYPITVLLTILIMLDSVRRATVSGIQWKERVYQVGKGLLRH